MDQAPFYAIWRTPKLHVFSQHHRSQNRNAVVATVRVGWSRLWWKKVNSVESYNDILQPKYIASIVSILNIGSIPYYSVLAQFSIGKYQSKKMKQVVKTLNIDEQTYRRLTSVLEEVMHSKRRDINYDDIINELIDVYQESRWGHIGSDVAGG
jgi:hypothetical protein